MLKKMGECFSAGLQFFFLQREVLLSPLKMFLFSKADFIQGVLSPKIFARPVPTYLF
jgi:hypothetical protein